MEIRQAIKMYLDCMASQDQDFALAYANKDKNLDECLLYIEHTMYKKAEEIAKKDKKQAVCLAPSDDEVFSLAVRYYYDVDLVVEGDSFSSVKILSRSATTFTEEEKAKMRREAIKKFQEDVIKEQREKKAKKQEKPKKPTSPTIVPDVSVPDDSVVWKEKHVAQQLSLF